MICYQIFIRSFADSNNDGIGDLNGITSRLDYLVELGVDSIWLTPISPSPSYHKYDVTDYYAIEPEYGTMEDFHELIKQAHAKNIKVIIDLVLNHCSSQHSMFVDAIGNTNSKYRNWFVWDDKDNITTYIDQWHPSPLAIDNQYYFAHFWEGMPDLNYDNQEVRDESIRIAQFWIAQGVDGFRLDAAKHIFPLEREPENHRWWREFRSSIGKDKSEFYIVGEVADKCEIISPYLDYALNCCFNFELAENIIESVNESRHLHLAPWLVFTYHCYATDDPHFNDALFLSNHDQDRVASRFKNDIRKIKMAANILFTLPGDIYIYYGEEIGMLGEKPDEQIREPFLWDVYDQALTRWMVPNYSTHTTVQPLSFQKRDTQSIYSHYKKLIELRKSMLGNISYSMEDAEYGSEILAYKLFDENNEYLLLHNLSPRNVLPKVEIADNAIIYFLNKAVMHASKTFKIAGFQSVIIKTPLSN